LEFLKIAGVSQTEDTKIFWYLFFRTHCIICPCEKCRYDSITRVYLCRLRLPATYAKCV